LGPAKWRGEARRRSGAVSDVVFVLLTVALFAGLALTVWAVEKL
jgi:hypothetical protein